MIIEQIMQQDVVTLFPESTLAEAIETMNSKHIRHLPIVSKDGLLAGILSDRDLKDASPSIFELKNRRDELKKPVNTVMRKNVITCHPLDFVEEISAVFYEHRIGCVPVIKHRKLVGIVTETDLLYTFVQLTGANQPGSQIEVKVQNRTGILSEVSAVFQKRNVNIASVLVYPDCDDQFKILVFRVQTMNPIGIITDLKKEGYKVLWPNLPEISS